MILTGSISGSISGSIGSIIGSIIRISENKMSYEDLVLGVLENDAKRVRAAMRNGMELDGYIGRLSRRTHTYFSPSRGSTCCFGVLKRFDGAELSWIAASLGHSEVLSILLESGAPCSKIKDGMSALQIARHNNRAKCVALLDPEGPSKPAPVAKPAPSHRAAPAAAPKKKKFCSNCGAKSNGGKFCSSCGSKM